MSKTLNDLIDKLNDTYAKLNELILNSDNIQYNNKKIQSKFSELDAIKIQIAKLNTTTDDIKLIRDKVFPTIQAETFNISNLTKLYEGIYDTNDIAKKLYKQYSQEPDKANATGLLDRIIDESVWKLTPIQKLLRNFMATNTPYKGLFIVHGTGVGKTCTAVTIAENLKGFIAENEKKIYVIREDEFKRQMFDINKVAKGKPALQCTGESYLDEIKKHNPSAVDNILGCMEGHKDDCHRIEKMIKREINKHYEFSSAIIWARKIHKKLESKTRNLTGPDKHRKRVEIIRLLFNDSALIIDEAHNLRNIGADETNHNSNGDDNTDGNLTMTILMDVLFYSQNMRLILLSATPMYDKPTDIFPLLNFLLTNDKRPKLNEADFFDKNNNLINEKMFLDKIKGYISYIRGNDPIDFPIRLNADVNLNADEFINIAKYPAKDIYGKPIENRVQHLKLIECKLSMDHQNVLLKHINVKDTLSSGNADNADKEDRLANLEAYVDDLEDNRFSVAYGTEIRISSFIYQTLEESGGATETCYGDRGLRAVTKKMQRQLTYYFKDEDYALRFKGDNLRNYGPKIWSCLQNVLNSTGPVYIYMTFTAAGIIPMAFALEMAGFVRYNGEKELLQSKHKDSQYRGEYIIYTGDPLLKKGAEHYFNLRERMIDEPNVKVVLSSKVGSEGLNLFGFREIHILDPWHNMNLIEQTIGRVIRYKSHAFMKNPAERNVTVYMYATSMNGKYKDRESIDLHIYAIAESKAIKAGRVEKLLKAGAIDCSITKPINYRPPELYKTPIILVTSTGKIIKHHIYDEPFSKDTLYMENSNYTCSIDKNASHDAKAHPAKLIGDLFGNIEKYEIELREIVGAVTAILRENMNMLETDIMTLIESAFQNSKTMDVKLVNDIYTYIIEYFNTADVIILDKYGRRARISVIMVDGLAGKQGILRLLPLSYFDKNMPSTKQDLRSLYSSMPGTLNIKKTVKNVNIYNYIALLKKDKHLLLEREDLDYNNILNKFASVVNFIVNKVDVTDTEKSAITDIFDTNIEVTTTRGYNELYKAIFDRLLYIEKLFLVQNIILKIKNHMRLTSVENHIYHAIRFLIVHEYEIYKSYDTHISNTDLFTADYITHPELLYGFVIAEYNKLSLFRYEQIPDEYNIKLLFHEDKTKLTSFINKRWGLMQTQIRHDLFGFMIYTKNASLPPLFKITDYFTRGKKKSVKGVTCGSKQVSEINTYFKVLDPERKLITYKSIKSRKIVCNDLELLFRIKNSWNVHKMYEPRYVYYFLCPEEYAIWQIFADK